MYIFSKYFQHFPGLTSSILNVGGYVILNALWGPQSLKL